MISISWNHVSLEFQIVKSSSCPISVILPISREITQNAANFPLKITKNRENYNSPISQFPHMVKCEITFTLISRKFLSRLITI